MGVAIATFSVVQSMVLAPLPFRDPHRLVAVWQADAAALETWQGTSLFTFVEWQRRSHALGPIVAVRNASLTLTDFEDRPTPLMQRVTYGYFELLGVVPVLGRTFTRDEDRTGGPAVVIISNDLWQERFGSDPRVIGRRLTLDGRAHTIVGVAPPGHENPVFGLVDRPQAFLPLQAPVMASRDFANVLVIGRLGDGTDIAAVREEFRRISADLQREFPATHRTVVASVQPLAERLVRDIRQPLFLLFAAVLCVVAAACGNVGNLLLARSISDGSEIPVRKALGAGSSRVAMLRVVEALVLSALGASAGVLVALLASRLLPDLVPRGVFLPTYTFDLNAGTLGLAAGLALVGGVLASLPSAAAAFRAPTGGALRTGRSTLPPRERRWSALLIAAEVVTAVVLLCGSALVSSGLRTLAASSPGFDPERALMFRSSVRGERYTAPDARRAYFDAVLERIVTLPGVSDVGIMDTLPIFPSFGQRATLSVAGRRLADEEVSTTLRLASRGIRRALGLRVSEGRWFDETDSRTSRSVAVVTESLPRALGLEGTAVGQTVRLALQSRTISAEIVGVVEEARSASEPDRRVPLVYLAYEQLPVQSDLAFIVRSRSENPGLLRAIRREAAAVDGSAPVFMARTLRDVAETTTSSLQFVSRLLTLLGTVALLLVMVGVHGTISCVVTARQAEFGVRRAIGASQASLLGLVLRDAMRPASAGVAVGLLLAILFGRILATYVRGTPSWDVRLYAAVAVLLMATAIGASLWPARRAARVDPIIAIRGESQ
jgi:predicted permease